MKTYNNRRGILATFFKYSFHRGWIADNPIPKVLPGGIQTYQRFSAGDRPRIMSADLQTSRIEEIDKLHAVVLRCNADSRDAARVLMKIQLAFRRCAVIRSRTRFTPFAVMSPSPPDANLP